MNGFGFEFGGKRRNGSSFNDLARGRGNRAPDVIRFGSDPPFLGNLEEVGTGRRVEISIDVFDKHFHLMGGSGSHKTLFLTDFLCWMIEETNRPVLFVDYGGDLYAFNRIKNACEMANRTLRYVSDEPGHDTHYFNPLKPFWPLGRWNARRVTDALVTSLFLDSDKDYWGRVNWSTIWMATEELVAGGVTEPTIGDYLDRLERITKKVRKNDAVESLLAFQQLASSPCLTPNGNPDEEICFERQSANKEVVVAHLPTLLSPAAKAIGGLCIFGTVGAAMKRKSKQQVVCAIDEAQTMVGKGFDDLLTLSRKYGVGLAPFVNQSMEQLRTPTMDARPLVFDNTTVKLYLTAYDDDVIQMIQSRSKDVIRELEGFSKSGPLNYGSSTKPYIDRVFKRDDAIDASATRFEGILLVDDGQKHHEPIRVRFKPLCSIEEHKRLAEIAFPEATVGTTVSGSRGNDNIEMNAQRRMRHARIESAFSIVESKESYATKASEKQ